MRQGESIWAAANGYPAMLWGKGGSIFCLSFVYVIELLSKELVSFKEKKHAALPCM